MREYYMEKVTNASTKMAYPSKMGARAGRMAVATEAMAATPLILVVDDTMGCEQAIIEIVMG